MKSIAQHNLRADLAQLNRRHCLHRAIRADRHERRRFNTAMDKLQTAATGEAVGIMQNKFHAFLSINIASP
jgi:hypothetical protein